MIEIMAKCPSVELIRYKNIINTSTEFRAKVEQSRLDLCQMDWKNRYELTFN